MSCSEASARRLATSAPFRQKVGLEGLFRSTLHCSGLKLESSNALMSTLIFLPSEEPGGRESCDRSFLKWLGIVGREGIGGAPALKSTGN